MSKSNLSRAAHAAQMQPDPYEPPDDLVTLALTFLNEATTSQYELNADETFTLCTACLSIDGDHTDECPVPALNKWAEFLGVDRA